jgi:glycosyltransferase involved in cell wall biosynthesis
MCPDPNCGQPATPSPGETDALTPVGPAIIRRPIAVLLSRFPLVTETFILREIIELERQGQPVVLVPLLRETPAVMHREAGQWVSRALYTPFLSLPILASNLRALRNRPRQYLRLLGKVLVGSLRSPSLLLGTLGIIPKSVYLAEQLRVQGIRHLHAHFATHPAMSALIISTLADTTFSFTVHAHDIFLRSSRAMLREKIRQASFVRSISRFNQEFLTALYPDVTDGKIHVVHVGIHPELYRPASSGPAAHNPVSGDHRRANTPPLQLLCVAGLKPYKGVPTLVEACRHLRDAGVVFECNIIGDGPMRNEIEALIRDSALEGQVHLCGARPQHEVAELMTQASVFVLPSIITAEGWMEGIPVALMEAMATGIPVVTSSLSGIPELVENGVSGILVEPGNAEQLARAIRRLIEEPELSRRIAEEGQKKIQEEFRIDSCVSHLLDSVDAHNDPPPRAFADCLCAPAGPLLDGKSIGVRQVHVGNDSTVAELLVSDGQQAREWVIKVHKEHSLASRSASERARHEFEALKRVDEAFRFTSPPNERFGVPKALHLDERTGSVVMEACRGRRLDALIRLARDSRKSEDWLSLVSAVHRTGRWLRAFQFHTRDGAPSGNTIDALLAGAIGDLDRCKKHLPATVVGKTRDKLLMLRELIVPDRIRLVGHHGDLWPGNVYADHLGVQVIDFEGQRRGLAYEDVAYLLVQMELFFPYPLARVRFARLSAAFLDGYLEKDMLDPAVFKLCRIAKVLQILAKTKPVTWHSDLRSWLRQMHLRRMIYEMVR